MTGAAQNWAMPLLQALDEEREHELLVDYNAFRDLVIAVYGDLDRRGNVEDRIGRLCQTGLVATYISTFRELVAQIDWNKSSLTVLGGRIKDKIWFQWLPQKVNPGGSTIGWQWHHKSMRDYEGDVKIDNLNQILFFPRFQPPYCEIRLQGFNQTMEHQDRCQWSLEQYE